MVATASYTVLQDLKSFLVCNAMNGMENPSMGGHVEAKGAME